MLIRLRNIQIKKKHIILKQIHSLNRSESKIKEGNVQTYLLQTPVLSSMNKQYKMK